MSISNDGYKRFAPIALDAIERSYVSGKYNNAVQPVVCLGNLPDVLGSSYVELNGGIGMDFHYGTATGIPDYDARILCSAPTAIGGVSQSSAITIQASSLVLAIPTSTTLNRMDNFGAGLVVPANAPFMACYTASAAGNITVPACTAGQRFFIRNSSGGNIAVVFAGGATSMGGGAIPAALANGLSWYCMCIQVAPDAYAWGVSPVAAFP